MMSETNANLVFELDGGLILEKGEAHNQGIPLFSAHWHIFAPTIVILVSYSFCWFLLALAGKSDTGLARLFIIVMSVFVPLLAAHAFLRFQTIRLQINNDRLVCHSGWPKDLAVEVPFAMVENIVVKRGMSGRLLGGGTLILNLTAEQKVVIADLAEPELAKEMIDALISSS